MGPPPLVVLKPSELTPLTAVALAELAERAGVPDGVLNLVMGEAAAIGERACSPASSPQAPRKSCNPNPLFPPLASPCTPSCFSSGQEMVASESIRKIGFTGSTAVGKLLMAGAAKSVKVSGLLP